MKPSIPDVIKNFLDYYKQNPSWGSLHIVLDDNNCSDGAVKHCIEYATTKNDISGKELAEILLTMSKTQRSKIAKSVYKLSNAPNQKL